MLRGSIELIARESTGYGDSQNEAIVGALVEAVRQTSGITVETEKSLRTTLVDTGSDQRIASELKDQIRSRSNGQIYSYDVISLTNQDQRWIAGLTVTLPRYRSPPQDHPTLASVAVLPFRANSQAGAELVRPWEQKLVTCLVQARRFQVVDRNYTAELDREDARLRQGDTPVTELARLGQQLGADYAVVGEITRFDLKHRAGSALLEEVSLNIDFRIVESATRQVRGANTASVSFTSDMLGQLGLSGDQRQAQEHLLNSLAFWVVTDLIEVVHPVKPGTVSMRVSPVAEYALYVNGMRVTGTDNDFALPAERDLTLQVIASNYEITQRKLRLEAGGNQVCEARLSAGPGMVLEDARKQINPTGYASLNGKSYLSFGLLGLGKKVAEGGTVKVNCQGCEYQVEVAAIDLSQGWYKLKYKGLSVTKRLQTMDSLGQGADSSPVLLVQQPSRGLVTPSLTWSKTAEVAWKQPPQALSRPMPAISTPTQPSVSPGQPKANQPKQNILRRVLDNVAQPPSQPKGNQAQPGTTPSQPKATPSQPAPNSSSKGSAKPSNQR